MNAFSSSSCCDLAWSHSKNAFFLIRPRFAALLLLARRFSRKGSSTEGDEEAAGCFIGTSEPPHDVVVTAVVIRDALG
jgi:hypothetical protein